MKKILVYLYEDELAPKGGQLGYNYILKKQLDKLGADNIHYIKLHRSFDKAAKTWVESIKNDRIRYILTILKSVLKKSIQMYGCNNKAVVKLDEYDIIHFHSAIDMFMVRDSLKDYRGKVVFTSHSPSLLSYEMYQGLTAFERQHMNWLYKNLTKIDEYAFSRADYFIFPCPEAEEPYYHTWQKYEKLKQDKGEKFRYLLTGTNARTAKVNRNTILKKYHIPEDAFIISYAGRHNELKGYDRLKQIGEWVLKNNKDIYFLIAGKEDPIHGLNHPRWIEVGWTSDPHSLIAASDVFVLPNRETYFDLVLLEVLSLGKVIVASRTGGNRYFSGKSKGIMLYDTIDEACDTLKLLSEMAPNDISELEHQNSTLYSENFTDEIFAKNYISIINSL